MKNIVKIIVFTIGLLFFNSCENEKDPIVSADGFELRKDQVSISPAVIVPVEDTNEFAKFNWDVAKNGSASISSYKLVIFDKDQDPNLLNPVEYSGNGLVVSSNSRTCTLTNKEFNTLLNKLNSYKCSEMNIDVRIKSILGTNPATAFIQYSNPINFKVTGYSTSQPILSLVKTGNTPATEPKLVASSFTTNVDYEGYVYLQPGSYKFYKPNACGDFTSATSFGGASGTLDPAAAAPSIVVTSAGHYLIKANLLNNTYTISEFTSIGVFGRATRGGVFGFNNVVPMVYDVTTKKWTLTMDLLKGQPFKFRALKWAGNLIVPPASAAFPKPDYIPSGSNTLVNLGSPTANTLSESSTTDVRTTGTTSLIETDKYLVEVDIANPRKYSYKLTKI